MHLIRVIPALLVLIFLLACQPSQRTVPGFTEPTNKALVKFFEKYRSYKGRKIAVFDGDGTVLGQAPHYLADECMYEHAGSASVSDEKMEILKKLAPQSNVSLPYVQGRVEYFSGLSLQSLRELGVRCYDSFYQGKVFPPMKALLALLQQQKFEVWIVTASPEALYQGFLARELQIPLTNIVGVKSIVKEGLTTTEIVHPVPQDEGKREAIETFIQDRPQFVGGNSRGDREMIEYSSDLKLIINPDEHIAEGQAESIAAYARKKGWLIEKMKDVRPVDFPAVSSQKWKVRMNKENP